MEDGIFPSIRSIGEAEEMEEERRLCYVAITRAKENICFTCSRRRMLHGRTSANPVSRFIEEISPDHIDRPAETIRNTHGTTYNFGGMGDYTDYKEYERYNRRRSYTFEEPGSQLPEKQYPVSPPPAKKQRASDPLPDFKEGDRIKHKAFGAGTIVSVKPTGGDALIKVEFDGAGTKQLMLKTAAQYITYESR